MRQLNLDDTGWEEPGEGREEASGRRFGKGEGGQWVFLGAGGQGERGGARIWQFCWILTLFLGSTEQPLATLFFSDLRHLVRWYRFK